VLGIIPLRGIGGCFENSMRTITIACTTVLSVGLLHQITIRASRVQVNEAALIAKAKAIHERVIKLDTHNDIDPANFTANCNYKMRLTTQMNLPKMVEGGMDVSFHSCPRQFREMVKR
jgi:membrane dipeptidase